MKKSGYVLLVLFITVGLLTAMPVIPARADCVENSAPDPDVWSCDNSVPVAGSPDTDGMDATTNDTTDTVTVVAGATVDDSSAPASNAVIAMTDGSLTNDGNVTAINDNDTAIFALGSADITNTGGVDAAGTGSTGILTLDGNVQNDGAVTADGTSGTGILTDTGDVVNNNIISADGEHGTGIATLGGDNTVTNNGAVSAIGQDGIGILTGAGSDTVTLGSTSSTSGGSFVAGVPGCDTTLSGVAICTQDGNDNVTVGSGATVNGVIDGGLDTDTLNFNAFTQGQLMGLSPADGTYGGYTWVNFEQLIGLLVQQGHGHGKGHGEVVSGPIVYFRSSLALGLGSADKLGIDVFAQPGRIAFIPFAALSSIDPGDAAVRFQVPNSDNWYVEVTNLGPYEPEPGQTQYQVNIYDGSSTLISQEHFHY